MRNKKIYIIISVILGLIFVYDICWLVKVLFFSNDITVGASYYINKLIPLLGFIGLIIFVATKFRNSALLRLYMCIIITGSFNEFCWYKMILSSKYTVVSNWLIIGIGVTVLLFLCCSAGLWLLVRERKVKLRFIITGEGAVAEFSPAKGWKRFVNYIIDEALLMYIIYNYFELNRHFAFTEDNYGREYGMAEQYFTGILIIMIYYIIFEGIFGTTAGKCVTDTVIVNVSGERAGFGRALGRTFSRLIPFEAFSFFRKDARGWHDSISGTYVTDSVHETDETEITETDERDLLRDIHV